MNMENLITKHMDIWTTAQMQKNGVGRGNGSANQSQYGIKKLRELILELAVCGKLLPQDPGDLPAPRPGIWFVYVLEYEGGSYYKGHTKDILERRKQHARGVGAEWSDKYPPSKLVHWEEFSSEHAAVEREKELKTGFGRKWLEREIQVGRTRQAGEPASVLLEKIAKEKARLIKEGKIKKQEQLPEITEDEKPFVLPKSWVWSRLGDCIALISGQHLIPQEYNEESSGIPYLTGPAEFGNLFPMPTRWTNLRKAVALKGNIVLTVKGTGVGKINLVNSLELAISRQLMAIRPFVTDRRYVYIYLQNMAEKFQSQTTGIAIPGIGRDDVNNSLFQLPPLPEQHRIVAKVNELMAVCDKLKTRIKDVQATQIQIANAIVEQAVA
jgi:predicted GIY-YIG superfamily endonuclease